jgi:hypothetical protein
MKRGWFPELARDRRVEAVGVALVAFGCLVTALVWTGVRDATNVAYQLPIIASGGLIAVGCFIVGGLLVVGGLVMTRFARLENARAARRILVAPATPPDGSDHEVQLPEESVERREKVKARRQASDASPEPSGN